MLTVVPGLLSADEVAKLRAIVEAGPWADGNVTSGAQSALAKRNEQLPEDSAAAQEGWRLVLDALADASLFVAAALPLKVFPPLFNRYAGGQAFGRHVDNAVRIKRGSDFRIRSDLSATLFLADPADYDGGELAIEGQFGESRVKAAAGDLIVYPASSLHRVEPVTRGVRLASFFWIQSMIRDEAARRLLFELDEGVQATAARLGQDDPAVIRLTGVYHNLLRRWAEM